MTFAFGFRTNLSPHWKFWVSRFPGWFSFLWFSVTIRIGFQVHVLKLESNFLSPEESKWREVTKIADPTKRKTLQPGKRPLPTGYRQQDRIDEIIEKQLQPGVERTEGQVLLEKELESKSFEHRFFGSQLIVQNVVVAKNLDRRLHQMEIMGNKVYIDGNPYAVNPTDLMKIKLELNKLQE